MHQNPSLLAGVDRLSQTARNLLKLNVSHAYDKLVVKSTGNEEAIEALRSLSPDQLLLSPPVNRDEATALLAGLWLWHDWLDESHKLAQSLHTASGSMWHAIMHRREGDFSNSKYWYARCENHPVLPALASMANDMINPFPADKLALRIVAGRWNADAFVDLVESTHNNPTDPRYALAVSLQQLEWRMLFDQCMRLA